MPVEKQQRKEVVINRRVFLTAADVFLPGKKTCGEAILGAGCEALGIDRRIVSDVALALGGAVRTTGPGKRRAA